MKTEREPIDMILKLLCV